MSKVVSIAARVAESQAAENFRFSDKTHALGVVAVQAEITRDAAWAAFTDALWSEGCRARYISRGDLLNQGMMIDIKRIMIEGRKILVSMPFTVKKGRKNVVENRDIEGAQAWEALRDMGSSGRETHPQVTMMGESVSAQVAFDRLDKIGSNGLKDYVRPRLQARENQESAVVKVSTADESGTESTKTDSTDTPSKSGKKARTTGVALVRKDLGTVEAHLKAAKADIPNYSDIQKALKALIAMLPQG